MSIRHNGYRKYQLRAFKNVQRSWILVAGLLVVACGDAMQPGVTSAPGSAPEPAPWQHVAGTTVEETLRQHRSLPDPRKEIWWNVAGEDMLWNNKNLHQIVPTVNVARGGQVAFLDRAIDPRATSYPVGTPAGDLPLEEFLGSEHSATMGLVIVEGGRIVFEAYPRMQPHEKPIWWSVTKVLVSTVLSVLEDRGLVDPQNAVDDYVPELAASSFAGVSLRDVLDMASGVDCEDGDYSDRSSCYYQFEASLGDAVRSEITPDNPYEMLKNLDVGRWAEPGTGFNYSGVNTFVAGWVVEAVTGMPFQDVLAREIWTRIGAEGDASILAGRYGIPLTSGGLLARVRDVARFGLLFVPSRTQLLEEPLLSQRYLQFLTGGGRPELLANARHPSPRGDDVRYNIDQWDLVFANGDLFKGGWAGQGLLANPRCDTVAAWVGYDAGPSRATVGLLRPLRQLLDDLYCDA